jgi:hypothetical protein
MRSGLQMPCCKFKIYTDSIFNFLKYLESVNFSTNYERELLRALMLLSLKQKFTS